MSIFHQANSNIYSGIRTREVEPGYPHHVVLRGNNRRKLFSYQPEYVLFLKCLANGLSKTGCLLYGASLLSNHIHLIIVPPSEQSLSKCIQRVAQRYAQVRNKRRRGSGKLFEQRFFSKVIRTESQLGIVTAYVDTNPELAGLECKLYRRYPWTSLGLHCGELSSSSPILSSLCSPSPWYLSLGKTYHARSNVYRDFVYAYAYKIYLLGYSDNLHRTESATQIARQTPWRFMRPDRTRAA